MTETETAELAEPAAPIEPSTQAEAIAEAVQEVLASQNTATEAQKEATARSIYLTWRNANLGGLPVAAFQQIETASSKLISAIAAAL